MTPREKLLGEINAILADHGFTFDEIRKVNRSWSAVVARDRAIYHVWSTRYDRRLMSLSKIGKLFNRDHTSIRVSIGRHMRLVGIDHPFAHEYEVKRGMRPGPGKKKLQDITGLKFGRLTVLSATDKAGIWSCRCDCGNEVTSPRNNLTSGNKRSCGCLRSKPKDLAGKRFGKLVAKQYVGGSKWLCECDCGAEKAVRSGDLTRGDTKSCGCLALSISEYRIAAWNRRIAVTSTQLHSAMVAAGDEDALTIDQVCARAGVTILRNPPPMGKFKPGETLEVVTIRSLVNRRYAAGARKVLEICADMAPVSADAVKAVEYLLYAPEYKDEMTPEQIRTLLSLDTFPLDRDVSIFVADRKVPRWRAMASVLYQNRKRARRA